MLPKDFDAVTLGDLQDLIDNEVSENDTLEYKQYALTDGKMEDRHKRKLMIEIAAFANHNGGIIVIGMKEEDGLPTEIIGTELNHSLFDKWQLMFRQLMATRIRPRLHGVKCKGLPLENGNLVILIYVPRSYGRPHSYYQDVDSFYIRYGNQSIPMSIDDIRRQFLHASTLQSQIRDFRNGRIADILANETVCDVGFEGKLVLHVIPEWSFEIGQVVDIHAVERFHSFVPMSGSSYESYYNAEGHCKIQKKRNQEIAEGYIQLFRNGIIEAVEVRLVSQHKDDKTIWIWSDMEAVLVKAAERSNALLEKLNVPKPFILSAALVSVKGYRALINQWSDTSPLLQKNIIVSQESVWDEDSSIEHAMKPVLNSLANAVGLPYSNAYTKEGEFTSIISQRMQALR